MKKDFFGKLPSGDDVFIYTLENKSASTRIMNFGAAIVSFKAYGCEIVGGFSSLEDYIIDDSHQGGTIGRVCNRIAGAKFSMDGKEYRLTENDNGNCLHGGCGFDRRVWDVISVSDNSITLFYSSSDMEEGFPARLDVFVTYTLSDSDVIIEYKALPYEKTPIALTNHSYFNLDGFGNDILSHKIMIFADRYTEVDTSLIPTGKHPFTKDTPFDFSSPKAIGKDLSDSLAGYDHNFILKENERESYGFSEKPLPVAAKVYGKNLSLSVYTDQPCIQFYTGNFLGKGPYFFGAVKQIRHGAFCLETQTEPNCVNRNEGFYSEGEIYTHTTVYSVGKIL